MKDDLLKFENRSDDWLAKQRAYEERVSAWDLDEAKKIKVEHEIRHASYNKQINQYKSYKKIDSKEAKIIVGIFTAISIGIMVLSFIMVLFGY